MGCMIARRLGLSSCAMLFVCGAFGGFLMAGMFVPPPAMPLDYEDLADAPESARFADSAASFDGTGGLASGSGSGRGGDGEEGGRLSAPSAPLPRPSTKDELETFEPVIRAPLTNVKSLPGQSLVVHLLRAGFPRSLKILENHGTKCYPGKSWKVLKFCRKPGGPGIRTTD